MRWGNVRTVIHDAFATHYTTPDPTQAGGTRYNSNATICHGVEAGAVIAAVCNQRPHLRAACIMFNAPDGPWLDLRDYVALRRRLWSDFCQRNPARLKHEGAIVATLDQVIHNYKRSCHNPLNVAPFNAKVMADCLGLETFRAVSMYHKQLTDQLTRYDNLALQPVWRVVHKQRGEDAQPDREAESAD